MRKRFFLLSTALLLFSWVNGADSVHAQVLTINSGSTLTISGGMLDVNCLDILVGSGGSLLLQTGKVQDKSVLTVDPGGTYTKTGGTVITCGVHSSYVIPNPGGSPAIIVLPKH